MENQNNFDPRRLAAFISQFSGRYSGQVFPQAKNTYRTPPAYEQKMEVGKDIIHGRFTTLKVWVHEPSFNYPNVAIFFSVNNKNSAFFKFNGISELRDLISWLTTVAEQLTQRLPEWQTKEVTVNSAIRQYSDALNAQEMITHE